MIEKVPAGGRPLQTTLNNKKHAMIRERIVELITTVVPRVFNTLTANKIFDRFRLGQETPLTIGIAASQVVDGFYSFLGFTRLTTSAVIRGVQEGHFGYTSGPKPALSAEDNYEIARNKVRFRVTVADDELGLDSGSIMLPQAIPQPRLRRPPALVRQTRKCSHPAGVLVGLSRPPELRRPDRGSISLRRRSRRASNSASMRTATACSPRGTPWPISPTSRAK